MSWLYFLVTGSQAYKDSLGVCKAFFEKQGAFTTGFIYTAVIAVVICLLYYLITRKSMGFAQIWTWFLSLFVTCCLCFFASASVCAINSTNDGLRHTLQEQVKQKTAAGGDVNEIQTQKNKMIKEYNKGALRCAPVNAFCWTNFVVGGIIFFGCSIGFKYFGGYGRNIPF